MTPRVECSFDTLAIQSRENASDAFHWAKRTLEETNMVFSASDVITLAKLRCDDWNASGILIGLQQVSDALSGIHEISEALNTFYINGFDLNHNGSTS